MRPRIRSIGYVVAATLLAGCAAQQAGVASTPAPSPVSGAGVRMGDLSAAQQQAVHDVLRVTLSPSLGMGLIVAFSLGLAAVLCLIGLLLVRSRDLVDHLGALGQRTQQLLPLGSAIVVTLLGAGISAKAVLAYLA